MDMTTKQKVALVSGGGAGIGKACSLKLSEEGVRVLIGDASPEDGQSTCDLIKAAGGEAHFCSGDVSDEAASRHWAEEAIARWGRIDILI